jgi:hypothetical protein
VRPYARLPERPSLVGRRQPDPQVAVLLAQGEAGEQALAGEVAPPPEHRGDAHALPGPQRAVERARRAGAAALERAAHPAAAAEGADASGAAAAPARHGTDSAIDSRAVAM